MRTINPHPNQSIFDVALEQFGTIEALYIIILDNPNVRLDEIPVATSVILRDVVAPDYRDDTTKKSLSNHKIVST